MFRGVQFLCVLTRVDQNDGMIPRKHTNTCWIWAIMGHQEHINMWELDQTCWEVLLFFTNRIPAQLGPKNQRFDLRAEAFYAP